MLDAEVFRDFVGGFIEVQHFEGRPEGLPNIVRCGPVNEFVNAVQVVAKLEWCGEQQPRTSPGKWVSKPDVSEILLPAVMDVPRPDDRGRLILMTDKGIFTLYRPGAKNFDRSKVEGLS